MNEDRPTRAKRRLGWIAPTVIALAILGILVVAVSLRRPEPKPAPPPPPAPVVEKVAPPSVATRADLLQDAAQAAADYAAGGSGGKALSGRQFVVRLPFGCEGPQTAASGAQAFFETGTEPGKTVRLVARPADWKALPQFADMTGEKAPEAVEGFWLLRPWDRTESCPKGQASTTVPALPTAPTPQTVGLAQIFTGGASRVPQRGGRPYERTLKLDAAQTADTAGYRLVLEGRIATYGDGRSVRCWAESPEHRPICIYAVELSRVAFEAGSTGQLLAEWRD